MTDKKYKVIVSDRAKRIYMRVYLLISLRFTICLIFTNTPYKVYNRV